MSNKSLIGSIELIDLPLFNIKNLPCKVDTGAFSSSLHAYDITPFLNENQENMVRFLFNCPISEEVLELEAKIIEYAEVKSSNGVKSMRYFIETLLRIGDENFTIQLNLANRDTMNYKMLLGNKALKGRFLVDCQFEYLKTKKIKG